MKWLSIGIIGIVVACAGNSSSLGNGPQEWRCAPAHAFVTTELSMIARVDPDTLEDWRTGQTLPGCRVTAAGVRVQTIRDKAREFYEQVRAAGWVRTPNPRDAPGEASLRFRKEDTDCLFNVYQGIMLGTDAEIEVTNALRPEGLQELFHVLVVCTPALPALP